jgi:hypothetical protein
MRKRLFRVESTHQLCAESNPRKVAFRGQTLTPDGPPAKVLSGFNGRPRCSRVFGLSSGPSMVAMVSSVPHNARKSRSDQKTRSSRRLSLSRRAVRAGLRYPFRPLRYGQEQSVPAARSRSDASAELPPVSARAA